MDDIREQHRQELRWHLAEEYGPRQEFIVEPEKKDYIKPIINMSETVQEQTKVCKRCGKVLPLTAFAKNKSRSDGLQEFCRECHKELNRAYLEKKKIKNYGHQI